MDTGGGTPAVRRQQKPSKRASAGGDEEEIKKANAMLRKVTKTAKREWADNIIEEGQVWEVARWRHGRKQSQITAMRTSTSQLTFDDNKIAESLANRFFAKDLGPIQEQVSPTTPLLIPRASGTPLCSRSWGST
jgi:hypothetical protein